MPVYKERKQGKFVVSVTPSGVRKIKGFPFYEGDYLWFNLKLKMPMQSKYTDSYTYQWEFWDDTESKLKKSGEDLFSFSNIRPVKKDKNRDYLYENNKWNMSFCKLNAIEVGELWELHKYHLLVNKELMRNYILDKGSKSRGRIGAWVSTLLSTLSNSWGSK